MDRCAVPDCDNKPAATLRNEARVCVDHYWVVRNRLEKLGLDLANYNGPVADLVTPEPLWAPIAAALMDEAETLRRAAWQLRSAAREVVADSRRRRQPPPEGTAPV